MLVEKLSKERSGTNYYEEKVPPYTLPDLFISNDGTKIASADQWNMMRRPKILELFRKNVYGRVPETPYKESFKVVSIDSHAVGGQATQKLVDIIIESSDKSLVIHLTLLYQMINSLYLYFC